MLERIQNDIKTAMKEKNIEVRNILRMIMSKAKDIAKSDKNRDVTSEDVMTAIHRQIKQNKETISFAEKENRDTNKEEKEIEILMSYLPEQMTEDEIKDLVASIISCIPEEERTNRSRGIVMKELSKYKDQLDMKIANKYVGEALN